MQSRVHEEFAGDFLGSGDFAASAAAARIAVNYERRNLDAWEILIAANARLGMDPARQEGVMREAALRLLPEVPGPREVLREPGLPEPAGPGGDEPRRTTRSAASRTG